MNISRLSFGSIMYVHISCWNFLNARSKLRVNSETLYDDSTEIFLALRSNRTRNIYKMLYAGSCSFNCNNLLAMIYTGCPF